MWHPQGGCHTPLGCDYLLRATIFQGRLILQELRYICTSCWSTSSQIIFLSKALKFCKSTFSCLEDFLDKIFSILADYSGNSSNVITQPFKLSFWYCSWVYLERKAAQKTQKLRICLQQFWYHYQLWQRQYRNVKKCHFSLKLLWDLAKFRASNS